MDATSGTAKPCFVVFRDEWQGLIAFCVARGDTAGEDALVSLAVLVGADLDRGAIDALADKYRQGAAEGKRPGVSLAEDPEWSGAAEAAARAILAGWEKGLE